MARSAASVIAPTSMAARRSSTSRQSSRTGPVGLPSASGGSWTTKVPPPRPRTDVRWPDCTSVVMAWRRVEREIPSCSASSRSTLRQAITTLVQSGHLIGARPRGAPFVVQEPPLAEGKATGPVRDDWREVLDLRVAIEVGTATLAADSEDDLALMRDCVDRMAASADFDDYRRADIRFHMAIAEASGAAPGRAGGRGRGRRLELIAHRPPAPRSSIIPTPCARW